MMANTCVPRVRTCATVLKRSASVMSVLSTSPYEIECTSGGCAAALTSTRNCVKSSVSGCVCGGGAKTESESERERVV